MTPPPDLLRAQLDADTRRRSSLVSRLVRWLSTDARALGGLRVELERCRIHHAHEVNRLRTLIDAGALERMRAAASRELATGPDARD